MKYSVITLGCRVNQADSLGFEGELLAAGAVPSSEDAADLVIVNTCSVTASADQAARQTIRRLTRINPDVRIVVTGCYAARRPDEVRDLPRVLRVVPNDDKARLVPILRDALRDLEETTIERFGLGDGACGAIVEPGVAGRTAYTLRVQTGCAEQCSYCIIPTTRGRPRSVPVEHVLVDVNRAVRSGFKEIVLTGVHLGSYGRDLEPPSSLIVLLRAIAGVAARQDDDGRRCRVRISSLEPMDCTDEIVDLVATLPVFAPHFHLPLQHASDGVLHAMVQAPFTLLLLGSRQRHPLACTGRLHRL